MPLSPISKLNPSKNKIPPPPKKKERLFWGRLTWTLSPDKISYLRWCYFFLKSISKVLFFYFCELFFKKLGKEFQSVLFNSPNIKIELKLIILRYAKKVFCLWYFVKIWIENYDLWFRSKDTYIIICSIFMCLSWFWLFLQ